MKFLLSLTALAVILSMQNNAQSNRIYSISVNGGCFIPVEKFSNRVNSGYNFGIDLETRKNNAAVFAFVPFPPVRGR